METILGSTLSVLAYETVTCPWMSRLSKRTDYTDLGACLVPFCCPDERNPRQHHEISGHVLRRFVCPASAPVYDLATLGVGNHPPKVEVGREESPDNEVDPAAAVVSASRSEPRRDEVR